MKADYVLDPANETSTKVMEVTEATGVDVVLEISGNPEHPPGLRFTAGGKSIVAGHSSKPMELNLADDIIFKGAIVQGIKRTLDVQDLVPDERPCSKPISWIWARSSRRPQAMTDFK